MLSRYDMNKRSQMQEGKNWILPNRFFRDSHWLESWKNHLHPSMGRMEGAWQWTLLMIRYFFTMLLRSADTFTSFPWKYKLFRNIPAFTVFRTPNLEKENTSGTPLEKLRIYTNFALDIDVHDEQRIRIQILLHLPAVLRIRKDPKLSAGSGTEIIVPNPKKSVKRSLIFRPK